MSHLVCVWWGGEDKDGPVDVEIDTSCLIWCVCVGGGGLEDKDGSVDVEMDTSCLICCVCVWGGGLEDKDGSVDAEDGYVMSHLVCVWGGGGGGS